MAKCVMAHLSFLSERDAMKGIKKEISWSNIYYLIGIYFLMVILVVTFLGGYLYHFMYKTVYSDFKQKNEQHLSSVVKRHENDMKILENIAFQIEQTDEIRRNYLKEDNNKIDALKNQLKGYTSTSEFFDLLFYYYHDDNYLYHYNSSINIRYFLNLGCLLEKVSSDELAEILHGQSLNWQIMPEQVVGGEWINRYIDGNGKCTIFLKAISYEKEETLMFFVPDSYYDELFADEAFDICINALFYDDKLIVSRNTEELLQENIEVTFSEHVDNTNLLPEITLQKKLTLGNEEYLLSVQKGRSGITYGTLQPMDVFYDKIRMEQGMVLLLTIICLCPVVVIILLASKGLLRKVRHLNQLLDEENYYDLNSIERGIQSLVMVNHESERENLVLKKTRFIRNFARGDFDCKEKAQEQADAAQMRIDFKQYVIVLLKNREMNNENKAYAFMLEDLHANETVEGYGIHMISNNQKLFVLFGNTEEELKAALENMLGIMKVYCEEYVLAVSGFYENYSDAPQAFLEADTAFDNHLLRDSSKIIYFTEINRDDYVNLMPDMYLHRLKYAIRSSDMAAVEVVVGDICNQLSRENVSLHAFRVFYNQIIHLLMSEWKGMEEQIGRYYNTFTLSQCMNLNDFHDILCEICKGIIDMSDGKNIKNSNIAEQAVVYMQAHFQDPDLTMNMLADHLGVSSVTLSVEFKNEMAVKPSDYLATLRMEKAKELLKNTDMLVREISLQVGYMDDRVFMRRFKKYTGMTPGQYRGA